MSVSIVAPVTCADRQVGLILGQQPVDQALRGRAATLRGVLGRERVRRRLVFGGYPRQFAYRRGHLVEGAQQRPGGVRRQVDVEPRRRLVFGQVGHVEQHRLAGGGEVGDQRRVVGDQ